MYIKRGKLRNGRVGENPILRNPEGNAYQVTFTAAFVWEKLNGQRTVTSIAKEVSNFSHQQDSNFGTVVQLIIDELAAVGLVRKLEQEVRG